MRRRNGNPSTRWLAVWLLCVAASGFAGCSGQPPPNDHAMRWTARMSHNTIDLEPCQLFRSEETVLCGTFEVYEDREAQKGRKISLAVVVAPATGRTPAVAPIFYFEGGPGVGAAKIAGFKVDAEPVQREANDLVFVDLRGTGDSNPLNCGPAGDPLKLGTYLKHPRWLVRRLRAQTYLDDPYGVDEMTACRDALQEKADLRLYTTAMAVDDVEDVRRALGYERINLTGNSYGSRAVLEFLRRHPGSVRAAEISNVAPASLRMPSTFARDTDRALGKLFEKCAADPGCREAFPNFEAELEEVLSRVRSEPIVAKARHPMTGWKGRVRVAYGPFALGIRGLLYSHEALVELPLLIHQAAQGDFLPILSRMAEQELPLELLLSKGMYLSVTCAEDVPFIDMEKAVREAQGTMLGDYRLRQQVDACAAWPRGEVPPELMEPVASDVPVLMISGELDPSTPPRYAAQVAKHLPNSLHIIVENDAHSVENGWDGCLDGISRAFFRSASVDGLDTSCVDEIELPPFELPH